MPLPYKLESTPRFDRLFSALPKDVQERIREIIKDNNKFMLASKRLHGPLRGLWSLRVGDYRVIYELQNNVALLHAVRPRKTAYE